MIFTETELSGAFIIEPTLFEDERGFFARTWSPTEFADQGLNPRLVECNVSFNNRRGTLRGMHYQAAPHGQVKLVRCSQGALYDVIIDLRPDSRTFKRWIAVGLSADKPLMLYVPDGFAHGFQTLADNTEVFYQMCSPYVRESSRGVRWDDPAFGIIWPPSDDRIIIDRDREYSDFSV